MRQPILSIAIVLPILVASTAPSFAQEVVAPKPIINPVSVTISPVLSQPVFNKGELVNELSSGGKHEAPGNTPRGPRTPPGPRPPRRDDIFLIPGQVLQPGVSVPQSLDINQVAPSF